ncbi:hypothetical protein [Burkholderia perseverans]|jgi:hypothetical protein|uniref:hypothetical protein n=1 Tax=Burkholderia perseverans TaxID=2615214 RepID=UPI001FEEBF4B|nr:hypothetical protein [Burkholderia perseverans]
MSTRYEQDRADVARFLPTNTVYHRIGEQDVWTFTKDTELQVVFTISLYFCADEDIPGYCAQLVSPTIEKAWQNIHVGHIFPDGVICLGGASMRTRRTLREAFAKSCLWAEGMAVMIRSREVGQPSEFPFSANNEEGEAYAGDAVLKPTGGRRG